MTIIDAMLPKNIIMALCVFLVGVFRKVASWRYTKSYTCCIKLRTPMNKVKMTPVMRSRRPGSSSRILSSSVRKDNAAASRLCRTLFDECDDANLDGDAAFAPITM